jgi:DNA-binding GntR family transcriptional regulator
MRHLGEITSVTHRSLGEQVYVQLRGMLIAGQFHPGERLTLRPLAEALGTSPMPVRDALRQLMVEQAIELLPNRTFRVPVMTVRRFVELRDIRLKLECMAAEKAASRIDDATFQEIGRICRWFDRECSRSSPDRKSLIRANQEFHFSIYRASEVETLVRIIEGLWTQIGPVLNLDIAEGSDRIVKKTPIAHHNALLDALKRHDPAAASEALAMDIIAAGEHILNKGVLAES